MKVIDLTKPDTSSGGGGVPPGEYTAIITHDTPGGYKGFIPYDRDTSLYGPLGVGSLDLSIGDEKMPDKGCIGQVSIMSGYNNKGDGYGSITNGWDNYGHGNYCIVTGISNNTSGGGVIMVGEALDTSGGDRMICAGICNTLPAGNPYVLQLGNGTVNRPSYGSLNPGDRVIQRDVPSDAMRVYRTGVAEMPTCDNALIDSIGNKALVTVEYMKAYADNAVLELRNELVAAGVLP